MRKVLYIFGQLSDLDVEWIKNNAIKEIIESDVEIIAENKLLNKLIIIINGKFKVTSNKIQNKEIAILNSGEILGEMSFIENLPASASVTSIEKSTIISIDKEKLNEKIDDDLEFASHFYKSISIFLASRLRSTVELLGYDQEVGLDDDMVYEDEVDMNVTDNLSMAGERFSRLIDHFS